jgi:hypothetical protein
MGFLAGADLGVVLRRNSARFVWALDKPGFLKDRRNIGILANISSRRGIGALLGELDRHATWFLACLG